MASRDNVKLAHSARTLYSTKHQVDASLGCYRRV